MPGVAVLDADLTDPAAVLGSAEARVLDRGRPVAVLALSVLHFIPDTARLAAVMADYTPA